MIQCTINTYHKLTSCPIILRKKVPSTYSNQIKRVNIVHIFYSTNSSKARRTANWEYIRQRKQKIINKNNERENSKRKACTYQVGDKVLLKERGTENKYEAPYK